MICVSLDIFRLSSSRWQFCDIIKNLPLCFHAMRSMVYRFDLESPPSPHPNFLFDQHPLLNPEDIVGTSFVYAALRCSPRVISLNLLYSQSCRAVPHCSEAER